MTLYNFIRDHNYILTQAAIDEVLSRSAHVTMHPRLGNALFIYDKKSKQIMSELYLEFIELACNADVPILIFTPTWRANSERLLEADIQSAVNEDAVSFLNELRSGWGKYKDHILIGGDMGCKNDAYRPGEALSTEKAKEFHAWQIDRLARGGVDFLAAGPLPALSEARGMALAMEGSHLPYTLNFVINRDGRLLDGTRLDHAVQEIDAACTTPPTGYMIGCSYPSFFKAKDLPDTVCSRIIGFQGNASSLDHSSLDEAEEIHADDVSDWGDRMIDLNKQHNIKILGGCCGTRLGHLQYIVDRL